MTGERRDERCRILVRLHHDLHVLLVELLAAERRQFLGNRLVLLVELCRRLDSELLRNRFQFLVGLGVLGHHHLGERFHFGARGLLHTHFSELYFGHVRHEHVLGEFLLLVLGGLLRRRSAPVRCRVLIAAWALRKRRRGRDGHRDRQCS